MSTELVPQTDTTPAVGGYTRDQLDLIKQTFAAGTNDLEFALFMETAKRTGLSPLAKQIYAVMRWSKKDQRKVMTIQTSIDGYRLVADRTGQADGQDGPYWCGDDGVWRETWFDKQPPRAAKVIVYKRGASRGYPGVAHWGEYVQTDDKGVTRFWQAMPALMLAKCAEALALRKAFPQELSGLYTSDEMAQADNPMGGRAHQSTSAPDVARVDRFQGAPAGAPAEVGPTRQESEAPGLAPLAGASGATQGAEAGGIPDEPGRNSQPPASPSRIDPLDRDDDTRWSEPAQRALTDLDQMADDLADAGAVADRRRLWLALSGHRINDTRPFEELRADDWPERMGAWDTARWAEAEAVLTAKLAPQEAAS